MDVIIITKNSVHPCFDECLRALNRSALKAGVFYNLIIVDGGSTDHTLDSVDAHCADSAMLACEVIHDVEGTRATARQKGMEAVESEFFVFLDSDVILSEGWFLEMIEHMKDPNVGAVWGMTVASNKDTQAYLNAMREVYRVDIDTITLAYAEKRGMTHDTMIRTVAVKGIQIPEEYHVFEDHFIRLHIEGGGWQWHNSSLAWCYHDRHERVGEEALLDAYYGYKLGVHSRGWLLKHVLLGWAKVMYLLLRTRNLSLLRTEAVKEYNFVKAAFRLMKERVFG